MIKPDITSNFEYDLSVQRSGEAIESLKFHVFTNIGAAD